MLFPNHQLKFWAGLLGVVMAAGCFIPAWAVDSGDAGVPGAFLCYGAGSRSAGMAGAFTGLADDVSSIYWNPGGLSSLKQNQVHAQFMTLMEGANFQFLGYNHIFSSIGTLAGALVLFNQGGAEQRSETNEALGDFSNTQFAALAGFGSDLTDQVSLGGTFKLIHQAVLGHSGTGFGIDLGALYRPFPFLHLGLAVQNVLAPSITLVNEAESYPLQISAGIAARLFDDRLRLDLDGIKNLEQNGIKSRLGIELVPMRDLFVRTGMDFFDLEVTAGAGYRYRDFQLDYATGFLTESMLHKISLSYFFGGFVFKIVPEPTTFSPVGINKVTVLRLQVKTKFPIRVWTLDIVNEANAVVKRFSGDGNPPDHIIWDGLQENASAMPDGEYRARLSVEDSAGEVLKTPEAMVVIQSVLPLGVSPIEMIR